MHLNPKGHELEGSQEVTYYNNSPDTLRMIRLKLLADLYRKGGQRANDVDPNDVTDGVEIEHLTINGVPVAKSAQNRHDCYLDIQLKSPLAAKSSLKLSVAWEYTLPASEHATQGMYMRPNNLFHPLFLS